MTRASRGMSLIEVLMSTGLVSIAVLGVLSAVAFGLRAAAYGQRVTEATNYARQVSEIIRSQGHAYLSTSSGWMNTGELTASQFNLDKFKLNSGTPFANLPADDVYRKSINVSVVGSSQYLDCLYRVSVVVYFYERGSLRRVEIVSLARRPR